MNFKKNWKILYRKVFQTQHKIGLKLLKQILVLQLNMINYKIFLTMSQ